MIIWAVFAVPELTQCKNKRICFTFRLFQLKEHHAYAVPTVHIKDHSFKLYLCAEFICLVYSMLTFYMMDLLDMFYQYTPNRTYSMREEKTKNKISTNHKPMYTVHINWLRCKPELFIHFYFKTVFIHFNLKKIPKFHFQSKCIGRMLLALSHNSITSFRTIHSSKAWNVFREKNFSHL